MATVIFGPVTWSMDRDEEGYRAYRIVHLIRASSPADGPATVLQTPGLPTPGSPWAFGNDIDLYVWCRADAKITPYEQGKDNEPVRFYLVEQFFSNKPLDRDKQRCHDIQIEDPLLEPQKVSGSFSKFTEEAEFDLFGQPITSSSHEPLTGKGVEFDNNRPTIRIEQNVPLLNWPLVASMIDTVNRYELWGFPRRTIKLSNVNWEQRFHGLCSIYYSRSFEFEIDYKGFDRDLLDEGSKVLHGKWNTTTGAWDLRNINGEEPDYMNPSHFDRAVDKDGNFIRVVLDGFGKPFVPGIQPPKFRDNGTWNTKEIEPPTAPESSGNPAPTGLVATIKNGGALPNKNHFYVVTAVDTDGETVSSNEVFKSNTDVNGKSVELTWNAVEGATGYRVYRKQVPVVPELVLYSLLAEIPVISNTPGKRRVVKYNESDFLLLGIPTSL